MKKMNLLFYLLLLPIFIWSQSLTETFEPFYSNLDSPTRLPEKIQQPDGFYNFGVYERPNGVQIEWTSSEERNNFGFEILRSHSGVEWTSIKFILSEGDAYQLNLDYQFFDRHPFMGENYYRVRKIYKDGSDAYSQSRQIYFMNQRADYNFNVYPNPASTSSEIYVSLADARQPVTVDLFDMNGQRIRQFIVSENQTSYRLGTLPPGFYVLTDRSDDSSIPSSKRLVVR